MGATLRRQKGAPRNFDSSPFGDMQGPKTLLSQLEPFQQQDNFPRDVIHPFASGASEACNRLQDLINATERISATLRLYDGSAQWSNPKLVSQMRQHASIEHSSQSAEKGVRHLAQTLKTRLGVSYGESIPLLAASVPDWCIEQLVSWGSSVGMETWRGDESPEGTLTVVLGAKLLVIDVDFSIQRVDPSQPKLTVTSVKTSNALVTGNSNSSPSTQLDAFLADIIREYCAEMQRDEDSRDPQRATVCRMRMIEHLRYLVLLDGLAIRKDNGGLGWFTDIDDLYPMLDELAINEARACAASLLSQTAPLDIFLLRSHSLPLPYLTVPSMSFLVHVSPSAYLDLIQNTSGKLATCLSFLDIALPDLKDALKTMSKGVTIATLSLQQLDGAHFYPGSLSMPNVTSRPTFLLCPSAANYDHSFPQTDSSFSMALCHTGSFADAEYAWILDFTEGGKKRGIVMSQSRMKAVELVVNPIGMGTNFSAITDTISQTSWVDLLLNSSAAAPSARYTTLYKSPNSIHPPLQLRLAIPEEPGYIVEKIPVHSVKEVWGILEIVREQCWLNETLLICDWTMEGSETEEKMPDNLQATEQDLHEVLTGTFTPRKIPVNVLLPSGTQADDLFRPTEFDFLHGTRPKIVMTCPERAPISGLIEITVAYDEKKPQGISVNIQGTVGLDINASNLEQVCRRGGTWGLPGRIWASGHGFS